MAVRHDAGGGVGDLAAPTAAAAAKAQLCHDGWQDVGETRARREINVAAGSSSVLVLVEVDTLTGQVHGEGFGPGSEVCRADLEAGAREVVAGWRDAVAALWRDWQDLPRPTGAVEQLVAAAAEIAVDPEAPDHVGAHVSSVNARLAGDLVRLQMRTAQLAGAYARSFAEHVVAALPSTVGSLHQLLVVVALVARTQEELWARARADAARLEVDLLAAMRSAGPAGGPDSGVALTLTVITALATAATALPTGGASSAVLAMIRAAGTAGAGIVNAASGTDPGAGPDGPLALGAGHPRDVLDRAKDALRALDTGITEVEAQLVALVDAALDLIDSGAVDLDHAGRAPRRATEVLDPHQDVVVDDAAIASITGLWLPSIAADLRRARRGLTLTAADGFERTGTIGLAPTGAWSGLERVQRRSELHLDRLAEQMEAAAVGLARAARELHLVDAAALRRARQLERRVERLDVDDPDHPAVVRGVRR